MTTTKLSEPLCGLLLSLAVAGLTACPGVDVTDPGKMGQDTDPRRCVTGWTSRWADNGLQIEVSKPPCPFAIADRNGAGSSSIDYVALVISPSGNILFDSYGRPESYVNAQVLNWYDASQIALAAFVSFQQDPNDQGRFRAEPRSTGNPGIFRVPGSPSQMLDSLHVDAEFMRLGGFSQGWKILPGDISSSAPILLGPGYVITGSTGKWRNEPHWDTTAYNYGWLLNNQEITNAVGDQYQATFGAGTYSLGTVAILADGSRDTVTRTVTVGPRLSVSISGPTQIRPGATCTWYAVVNGHAPYSYQWTIDGASGGSGSSATGSKDPGNWNSSFTVSVSVTDAVGAPGNGQITVYEDPSAGLCAY